MLIRSGDRRTLSIDLFLAASLSSIAGALNAVGFLLAGSFTANMTGNVSAFADHLAEGRGLYALSFAGLVVTFIAGAGFAAFVIGRGLRRQTVSVYAQMIAVEAVLLILLSLMLLGGTGVDPDLLVIFVLSFVMGLQNAVTTLISRARVRTTHISGMATDVGIELAAMTSTPEARAEALPRLKLHGLTLLCFAVGGVAGALIFVAIGAHIFWIAALLLLTLAVPEILIAHRRPGPADDRF